MAPEIEVVMEAYSLIQKYGLKAVAVAVVAFSSRQICGMSQSIVPGNLICLSSSPNDPV